MQGKLLDHAAKAGLPKSFADGYFPAARGKAKAKGEAKAPGKGEPK